MDKNLAAENAENTKESDRCGERSLPGTYKEEITKAMTRMAEDPLVCFIGYGIRTGRAGGTLKGVSEAQLIETPVAENLMVGMAIGLALKGRRPVVYIERFDFILNGSDAIVNHLDKIATMSRGEFAPKILIRAFVGKKNKALYTGATHTQDFTKAMKELVSFPVLPLMNWHAADVKHVFEAAHYNLGSPNGCSTLVVEYGDLC